MHPHIILLLLLFSTSIDSFANVLFFNHHEEMIAISAVNHFGMKHCIFIDDDQDSDFVSLKRFFRENVMVMVRSYEQLLGYLEMGSILNVKTMVIAKEKNLIKLVEFFQFLEKADMGYRTHYFTWFIFIESYESFVADWEKLLVPYNCEFVIGFPMSNDTYKLVEVYKLKNRSFYNGLGIFQNNEMLIPNDYLYSRRMDLNGTKLEINAPPQGPSSPRDRRHYEILNDTARFMNIRYEYEPLGNIDRRLYNISGEILEVPFPFHADFYVTDFFGPMYKSLINWYIRYPKLDEQEDYYTRPFHSNLWGCILGFILLGSFWGFIMKKTTDFFKILEKISIVDCVFMGFECFCNQLGCSRDVSLRKTPFRLICITYQFAAFFVIPFFSATIISYLAIKLPIIPFMSLAEFIENGRYILTFHDEHFLDYYFKYSKNPTLRHIYSNMTWVYNRSMPDMWIERFCSENLVISFPDIDIYSYNHIKCDFLRIQHPVTFSFTGLLLKKHSQFEEVFNYNLLRFYTSGIIKKLQSVTEDSTVIAAEVTEMFKPVEVKQMVQVFSFVGVGVILATILFIFEFFVKKMCECKKSKTAELKCRTRSDKFLIRLAAR